MIIGIEWSTQDRIEEYLVVYTKQWKRIQKEERKKRKRKGKSIMVVVDDDDWQGGEREEEKEKKKEVIHSDLNSIFCIFDFGCVCTLLLLYVNM